MWVKGWEGGGVKGEGEGLGRWWSEGEKMKGEDEGLGVRSEGEGLGG